MANVLVGNVTNNGAGGSLSFSHTTATNSRRLLQVTVVWWDESATPLTGITYNGISLTEAVTGRLVFGDTSVAAAAIYYLIAPATGANTVAATFSGTPSEGPTIIAVDLYNVRQTSPILATDTDSADAGNATVAVSMAGKVGGIGIAAVYSFADAVIGSGAGQSRLDTHTYNSDTNATDSKAGAATIAMTFTGVEAPAMAAVSVAPAVDSVMPFYSAIRTRRSPLIRM